MLIQTLSITLLVSGLCAIAALIAAGWVEERAARRKCRPVMTIVGFRQPSHAHSEGDTPSCGWPCTVLLTIAVLALAYAFMHVAAAAGF